MLKTLTSLDPFSLGLNVAGAVAGLTPLGPFMRSVTLYDQEKYLGNAANAANAKSVSDRIATAVADSINNGAKILQGVPFYRSGILRYGIEERSRMCDHPIEDGSVVTDHKVKEPVSFSCAMAMPEFLGGLVVDQLNEFYRESKKVMVQCATGVYMNMILAEKPTNIAPENASRPIFDLKFREVVIVTPEANGSMSDPGNIASASDADAKKNTVLSDAITSNDTVSSILGKISAI